MTTAMHDLFAAARQDAPDGAVREDIWERVASATSAGAVVSGGSAGGGISAAPVTSGGLKLLSVGGLIGAASTALGVVLALGVASPDNVGTGVASARGVAPATNERRDPRSLVAGARLADPMPRARAPVPPPRVPP